MVGETLANPDNQDAEDLLDFSSKNDLIPPEQLEVILQMLKQLSNEEKQRYFEVLDRSEFGVSWKHQIEAKKYQDVIQKFLSRKFGAKSFDLQQKVLRMTDLETLDFVLEELFAINTFEEAKAVINDGIASSVNK